MSEIQNLILDALDDIREACRTHRIKDYAEMSNAQLIGVVADWDDLDTQKLEELPAVHRDVGYIQGLAAGLDMTVLELWDNYGWSESQKE